MATVSTSGAMVTVTAIASGSATVTVTATDPGELSASQEFGVTVEEPNRAPEITDSIPPQTLTVGDTVRLDASAHFSDPDGDELSYEAVSSNPEIVTALAMGAMIEIEAQAVGTTVVTVSVTDPEGLTAEQQVMVTVEGPPPMVADSIPTHDMIVDSMVTLDVSPYFEGDDLTYMAMSSDEMVAVASVEGSTVTTMGVDAVEDSISVAILSVTATNASGASVTQDSIMVRVHQEEYDTLPGLTVKEDGSLVAEISAGTTLHAQPLPPSPTASRSAAQPFTVFWSEWQRAVGSGWVTAQDNAKAHITPSRMRAGGSVCPIKIEDDKFPPGIYRLGRPCADRRGVRFLPDQHVRKETGGLAGRSPTGPHRREDKRGRGSRSRSRLSSSPACVILAAIGGRLLPAGEYDRREDEQGRICRQTPASPPLRNIIHSPAADPPPFSSGGRRRFMRRVTPPKKLEPERSTSWLPSYR